jgi:hypothetical protein
MSVLISIALITKGFIVLLNRCASWFGSGYYFKKAFRERKKRYIFLAVLISVVLLILMKMTLSHK